MNRSNDWQRGLCGRVLLACLIVTLVLTHDILCSFILFVLHVTEIHGHCSCLLKKLPTNNKIHSVSAPRFILAVASECM